MIGYLKGSVLLSEERSLLLDVGGVGYKVYVTTDTLEKLKSGSEAEFYTHLSVREDALELFGFQSREEVRFFELLITISGIGPKSAVAILSTTPLGKLRSAVAAGDTGYLTKISGIGRKTAEKIVLELREKMGTTETHAGMQEESDVLEALRALGYADKDIRETLKKISSSLNTKERIKEALKQLNS